MHFAPLLQGCNQLHVDAATILSDPMAFLRLIDDYVRPSISSPWLVVLIRLSYPL